MMLMEKLARLLDVIPKNNNSLPLKTILEYLWNELRYDFGDKQIFSANLDKFSRSDNSMRLFHIIGWVSFIRIFLGGLKCEFSTKMFIKYTPNQLTVMKKLSKEILQKILVTLTAFILRNIGTNITYIS